MGEAKVIQNFIEAFGKSCILAALRNIFFKANTKVTNVIPKSVHQLAL